jgi:LysR family transcriptional regulator, glycine cleavage system transcriptional activator
VALARSSILGLEIERWRLVEPFDIEAPLQEAFYLLSPNSAATTPTPRHSATG